MLSLKESVHVPVPVNVPGFFSSAQKRQNKPGTFTGTGTFTGLFIAAFAAFATGCTPSIGDKCVSSTDCSQRGDRLCDTSQPGGYCTIYNCVGGGCPRGSACVLFNGSMPGCPYNDRSVSRFARSFCMATCSKASSCRGGYQCSTVLGAPWYAQNLESDQEQRICIASPTYAVDGIDGGADVPEVCNASGPPVAPLNPPERFSDAGPEESDAAEDGDASDDTRDY